jgi:hypothetical protein
LLEKILGFSVSREWEFSGRGVTLSANRLVFGPRQTCPNERSQSNPKSDVFPLSDARRTILGFKDSFRRAPKSTRT